MPQPTNPLSGTLHEIRFREIFPWVILVRALRISLLIRVLGLAFLGVVLTQWGWAALDGVFSATPAQLGQLTESQSIDSTVGPELFDPNTQSKPSAAVVVSPLRIVAEHPFAGPLVHGWVWIAEPFLRLAATESTWLLCMNLTLSGIWAIAVWAVFGGAIARIAAIYFTRGETLGPVKAIQSAVSKAPAIAGAPLITMATVVALALPLALVGLLTRLDFLAFLVGLFWIVLLAGGLVLAIVLLGLLLGWPLMWATVAVEQTDAFDGVSRCYAYVYQRPLSLIFYLVVATSLGLLGEAVVTYFVAAGTTLTEWAVSWGSGNSRIAELVVPANGDASTSLGGLATTGAYGIAFWKSALQTVADSFPMAYLWPATVGIYLLLRQQVDSTEMEEITLGKSDPPQGLPNLTPDEAGIPQVDPSQPSGD